MVSEIKYIALPAALPPALPNPISRIATADLGLPCRRCLKDAGPGEEVHLVYYDPFPPIYSTKPASPYRHAGAIFVHVDESQCKPFDHSEAQGKIPETQLGRLMSVRGYDKDDMMIASDIVECKDGDAGLLESALGRMSEGMGEMAGGKGVEYVHLHNARQGCYALSVVKA